MNRNKTKYINTVLMYFASFNAIIVTDAKHNLALFFFV